MNVSEYVCKTFFEELGSHFLKCTENIEKLLKPVTFLKFCSSKGIFLPYFRNSTKRLSILFNVLQVHFNKSLCTMQIFDLITRDNASDTANCCQMMSYSHVEKDLAFWYFIPSKFILHIYVKLQKKTIKLK